MTFSIYAFQNSDSNNFQSCILLAGTYLKSYLVLIYKPEEKEWKQRNRRRKRREAEGCLSSLALRDATSISPSAPERLPVVWLPNGSQRRHVQHLLFYQVHSSVHWLPGSLKEVSSQMLLSRSSGSMSSSVPRSGLLVRLPLMLLLCF